MIQADPVYSLKNAYISIKAETTLENMFTNVELFGSHFFLILLLGMLLSRP